LPTGRWLAEAGAAGILLALVAGAMGFATGLLHWDPRPPAEIALAALTALFVPALGEELLFRGPWIPSREEGPSALWPILLSTAAFTVWHPLETLWLPGARQLFTRPDFLAWAAALGLVCAVLRRRSGSIWPPVAVHWLAVVAWQGWLGGPGAAAMG
jgi:predicted Abi (CAAX) family protease